MMHMHVLVLFLLVLPSGARRSIRIHDSHHGQPLRVARWFQPFQRHAEEAVAEASKLTERAGIESNKILREAKESAAVEASKLTERAGSESKRILSEAKANIDAMLKAAEREKDDIYAEASVKAKSLTDAANQIVADAKS